MLGKTTNNPAICDVCGQKYKRRELKYQVIAGKPTKILACEECLDLDNPQLLLGKVKAVDPNPIYDPRIDPALAINLNGWGWNPVGNVGLTMIGYPTSFVNYPDYSPFYRIQ